MIKRIDWFGLLPAIYYLLLSPYAKLRRRKPSAYPQTEFDREAPTYWDQHASAGSTHIRKMFPDR